MSSKEHVTLRDKGYIDILYDIIVPNNLTKTQISELKKCVFNESLLNKCIHIKYNKYEGLFDICTRDTPFFEYNTYNYDSSHCFLTVTFTCDYSIIFYGDITYRYIMGKNYPDELENDNYPIVEFDKTLFFNKIKDAVSKNPYLNGVEILEIKWDTDPSLLNFDNSEIECN